MSAPAAVHHNVHPHLVQGSCGRCSAPQSASVAANASTLSGDGIGTFRSRRARRWWAVVTHAAPPSLGQYVPEFSEEFSCNGNGAT